MPKKIKLSLENLNVKSFTLTPNTLKGGEISETSPCPSVPCDGTATFYAGKGCYNDDTKFPCA